MTFQEKLKNREVVLGTMLSELPSANLPRLFQVAGFDYFIIDCEHGSFDFSQVANLIGIANGYGIPAIVRIPMIEREFITKVLDAGADGLLVPMVNTKEEAEKVIEISKYSPLGKRGVSTTRAHSNYSPPPLKEYLKLANERTSIFVQLETQEAVKNVEDIASVEGITAIMIGPNDMATDLGVPGETGHPKMFEAIEKVIAAANKAGLPSGIIESHQDYLKKCRSLGMTVFSCGSELGMLLSAAKQNVKNFAD
ncbi:HpcH/HpaI aldolase family protein [Enterococcus avium]